MQTAVNNLNIECRKNYQYNKMCCNYILVGKIHSSDVLDNKIEVLIYKINYLQISRK